MRRKQIIEKIRTLPDDILREVSDYIDFLETKRKGKENEWQWLVKDADKIGEADFYNYLEGLTNYENMLAQGKIKWK